jgi:prepilin peptidase CpaA
MDSILLSILVPLLFLTSYCDFCWHIIPNFITLPLVAIGIIVNLLILGVHGLGTSAAGGAIGFGCFLLLYYIKAMGAGDVKLIAGVGAVVGGSKIFSVLFLTIIAGGLIAILQIVITLSQFYVFRALRDRNNKHKSVSPLKTGLKKTIPYGVAISAGTLASFVI